MARISVLRNGGLAELSMARSIPEWLSSYRERSLTVECLQHRLDVVRHSAIVSKNETLIGRSDAPEIDITLLDVRISRRHARIMRREECYSIEDLKSRNGVLLNGQKIGPIAVELADQDEIRIADFLLRFRTDAAELVSRSPKGALLRFDRRWRSSDVLALAEGIQEDKAYDRLGILADALMDAGCDNDWLLEQCRLERDYLNGCWVVDLVLDRI